MKERRERRKLKLNYEGKFLLIGTIIGTLLGIIWEDSSHHFHIFPNNFHESISTLRQESAEQLLEYIEGKWISATGDVTITINYSKTKEIIIINIINDKSEEKIYKILEIGKINGLVGLVSLNVCDISKQCNDIIPLQFNRIFGISETITISFDSRISKCINNDCTRAFTRIE